MTRILIQRGNGSSSNQNRSSASSSSSRPETQLNAPQQANPTLNMVPDDNREVLIESHETVDAGESWMVVNAESSTEIVDVSSVQASLVPSETPTVATESYTCGLDGPTVDSERTENPHPPPPPLPPKHLVMRKPANGISNSVKIGSPKRSVGRPGRSSPSGSRPSSPRSTGDCEGGYNSADEQNAPFVPIFFDPERERQFEIDIRRSKGLELRRMVEDGNCLFRAVAHQVYGDSEAYDVVRQMCLDYMEREKDHFSPFITEGFSSYCKRKRRDKVYGNNAEIQAISEMYNRPIHIYSYTTEPINTFHGNYNTDSPPVRLSYHQGNHYNSLVDPRSMAIGAGLGYSSLRGRNVDKDQVKAAIKAQQDQQIDNALLAEGQLYSDLELTEKEIERMVMENSRAEYLASSWNNYSKGTAEPSSSGATPSGSETKEDCGLSLSVQSLLSMGFSYSRAVEAYSIFGDDVDSMVTYLVETSAQERRKGKAADC